MHFLTRGNRHSRSDAPPVRASIAAVLAVVPVICILAVACTSPGKDVRPNIVLVLVDTLRADHLSAYGYQRKTTPYIDELASKGTLFEAAIAQSSWTAPSMASLWTSRLPSEVGVEAMPRPDGLRFIADRFVTGMREDAVTLAEVLRDAGYSTIGVTCNSFTTDKFFIMQGFTEQAYFSGLADDLFATALGVVDRRPNKESPAFVYVHLTDVHQPVRPPKPYDRMFETIDGKPHRSQHSHWDFQLGLNLNTKAFRRYKSHRLALYDGALRFVDDKLRKFRSELDKRGFADNTVMIVASDHGEDFWENAEFQCEQHIDPRGICGIGHGHSMSQPVLHVPLVFSGAGIPTGRVSHQVRNLDIAPTVLRLAGIEEIPSEMQGRDLFAGTSPRLAISEDIAYGHNARAIQDGSHKLVVYEQTKTGQTHFLFRKRPGESRETLVADPEIQNRFAGALAAKQQSVRDGRAVEIDDETRSRLRALGYVK